MPRRVASYHSDEDSSLEVGTPHLPILTGAQRRRFLEEQQKIIRNIIRTYSLNRTVFYTLFDVELEELLGVQKVIYEIIFDQTSRTTYLRIIAGTYHTAPSHGFKGIEAIFLKGLPTTIVTATRSYLKRVFSPGTKWKSILTRNRSREESD
jgi:hypothetical protein